KPGGASGKAARTFGRLEAYNESEMAVQKQRELRFRQCADLGVDHRAVAEQHQRGDAADAVLGRHRLVFVDVDLDDVQLARVVTRSLGEDRGDHLARAAPFGPVIDEHRLVGLQYVLLERCIGYVLDGHFCSCKSGKHSTVAAASGDSGEAPRVRLIESLRAGLPAVRRGQPGQVRKEAATAIPRACRGSGSPTRSIPPVADAMTHQVLARKWRPRDFESL